MDNSAIGRDWDAVIVGAGLAGSLIAYHLALKGLRVLVIEAGPELSDIDKGHLAAAQRFMTASIRTPDSAYEPHDKAPRPATVGDTYYIQAGPDVFRSIYERRLGGTTWHWLGTCLRLLPSDFEIKTRYAQGLDWPISYAELEPWYCDAEAELGVAGDSALHDGILGAFRSRPYPMPLIWQTFSDRVIASAVRGLRASGNEVAVISTPQARNSEPYDGRPPCAGNSSCIPVCPIGAKYDASVHVRKAQAAGVVFRFEAVASAVTAGRTGAISGVNYLRWDGSSATATGKVYVLAAHAIETAKLMLMSRFGSSSYSVGNSSGQVGRNLMDHNVKLSFGLAAQPLYQFRGPLSTSGIESLRDGPFRATRAAFRVEIGNDGWSWPTNAPFSDVSALADQSLFGRQLRTQLAQRVTRQLRLASLVEVLPDEANRVVPSPTEKDALGIPRPVLSYAIPEYTNRGFEAAIDLHQAVFDRLNATEVSHKPFLPYFGAGHIMGTTRMGVNPRTSVVDADLKCHDHPNLFVVGSSVFPTAGTANPTLTVAALALRAAARIYARLSGGA